jgi:hypothetical protein
MNMTSLLFFYYIYWRGRHPALHLVFIIFYRTGEAPMMSLLLFILALFLGFVSPIPMGIHKVSTTLLKNH